jgi:hypothetical protein
VIDVELTHEQTTYRLPAGTGIPIRHFDEDIRLVPGQAASRPVAATDDPELPVAA